MASITRTLATDTLANGNDIDLVLTTAPDDVNYWSAKWYWLVQVITPKGKYVKVIFTLKRPKPTHAIISL